jgi:hypothetical protein
MKWTFATLAAAIGLLIAAPAASADFDYSPDPVKQGKKLNVVADDCVSGPGYKAYVAIEVYKNSDPEGSAPKKRLYVAASPTGITRIPIKIKKKKFKPGLYEIFVACIHEFDTGGRGIWWEDDDDFVVVKRGLIIPHQ